MPHGGCHGGGKKDISILFTYVCNEKYLVDSGTFGFLITQSVFKTKGAGEGFRRFQLKNAPLKVMETHDFVDIRPFEGTNNKPAAIILRKGERTTYPVKYVVWRKLGDVGHKESLRTASEKLHSVDMVAFPSDSDNILSPWITVPWNAAAVVQKVYGKSSYSVYEGINSGGMNGVYWVKILGVIDQYRKAIDISTSLREILNISNEAHVKELVIENITGGMGRKVKEVRDRVEDFFIYPMLKSRHVRKWKINGYSYTLQMQDPIKRVGFDERWVSNHFPRTHEYLLKFEADLKKRKSQAVRQLTEKGAFYTMYAVGEYTYAPYKVVWNQMGNKIAACVVSRVPDEFLGEKLVLPEHVLAFIPTTSEDEAHYICAIMNSSVTDMILRAIAGGTKSFGTPKIIEDTIRIPKYREDNEIHRKLSDLSKKAHEDAQKGENVSEIETEIDKVIIMLYGISEGNLRTVKETIRIQEGEMPERIVN